MVTNQSGVARGLYGIDDVARVHHHIAERLAEFGAHIDLFLYCPYHPDGVVEAFARSSEDRKPRPGMAKAAAQALNLNLAESWVVGDRPEDIGLAQAVDASAVYLGPASSAPPGVRAMPRPRLGHSVHPRTDRGMTSTVDLEILAPEAPGQVAKFPTVPHRRAASYCGAYLEESVRAASSIDLAAVERAAAILLEAYCAWAAVFSCGNGGSASVANHLQCDHTKGVRTDTDLTPRVTSLSTNVELLTAIANDIAFEQVFTYQLQSQARSRRRPRGDLVVRLLAQHRQRAARSPATTASAPSR